MTDIDLGPRAVQLNAADGRVEPEQRSTRKTLEQMTGLFAASPSNARAQELVYSTSTPAVHEAEGELALNETRIEPGDLDGEFFMTHGHIHVRPDGEIYVGQRGVGGVVFERDGDVRWVPMSPGAACTIPPGWKHRSVNTGDEPFIFLSVYTALSGQNYEPVREHGMGARVRRTTHGYQVVTDNGDTIAEHSEEAQ